MAKKLSMKAFLDGLAELAQGLRRDIEANVDGFDPDPRAQARRKKEAAQSYAFFAKTYFPHYIQGDPSLLHEYLYDRLPRMVRENRGTKLALAAPRGEAKSTLVSQIFVLWCVAHAHRHYIPILMDAFEQAATMLEAIKAELEANPRLKMDYPHICGEGRVWQAGTIITANDIKIQAFGSGKRLRGLRHGPHRPDLVICDDLENDENVRSPEQRDKLQSWLTKAVLKLGRADDVLDVVIIGTVLHYDSVLARLLKNPFWESRTFKAIVSWPNRMDLWDQWEATYLNQGEKAAEAFYDTHKMAMETGAVLSWPTMRPLRKLMMIRARDGHASFDSELQNDPINSEDAPFSKLTFWSQEDPEWVYFGAVDPSLGKMGQGRDPSAILVGGFNRATGVLDVVEAQIARRLPDRIIEDVIKLQQTYRCMVWVVESIQFQEFFRNELVKRSAQRGVPVPAVGVKPNSDKELRIETLQPHVVNGLIRFHTSQTTLLEQLRHFPKADHDDGPDALEMLWQAATSRCTSYAYEAVHTGSGLGRTLRNQKGCY